MTEDFASKLKLRVLKFFKIDLTLNDILGLQLYHLPSFGVYLREDKTLRLYGEETISYKKLLDFVNDQSKLLTKEEVKELEKEAEVKHFDSLISGLGNKSESTVRHEDYDL